jgi:hypothetical protein
VHLQPEDASDEWNWQIVTGYNIPTLRYKCILQNAKSLGPALIFSGSIRLMLVVRENQ